MNLERQISDILILRKLPHTWPFWVLLGLFLLHYFVAACILAIRGAKGRWWPMWAIPLAVLLLVPGMPVLDTIVCLMLSHYYAKLQRMHIDTFPTVWHGMLDTRRVVQEFLEAIPTAALQSYIFVAGNSPTLGVYLDTNLYVLSTVGSFSQILFVSAKVWWIAAVDGVRPGAVVWNMLSYSVPPRPTSQAAQSAWAAAQMTQL